MIPEAITPERVSVARNFGPFPVGLVDGEWYDSAVILCGRDAMQRCGPVPREWVEDA